ncbi:STS14 protein isoform X1 [Punica granatum]|uniref:STS14 protein isoform X1 n=1 Tax=Punica granatum TaxID=22663 RepID=A0A218WIQ5_PUNGR|nr:STS14 protein isoform X1 [Punica granatum]OWM72516.1 hypothetical protein CDL15_Pgr018369 [Punica granatum]
MARLVLLSLVLLLATCHGSAHAIRPVATQPRATPAAFPPNASQEFLEAHNDARSGVGVGPLKWSQALANLTSLLVRYQRDKMGCQFANLTAGKYGGNQLLASGQAVAPRAAVEEWVKEKSFYNHADNSCAPNRQCGVYTQASWTAANPQEEVLATSSLRLVVACKAANPVVWRNSMELGCAQATCPKDQTSLTICFYNPPGNVVGERPY